MKVFSFPRPDGQFDMVIREEVDVPLNGQDNRAIATYLSQRPYPTVVLQDTFSDGTVGYVALHPDLEGCVSQGMTVEEALNNLADARAEYIFSLLQDGLSVPDPNGSK